MDAIVPETTSAYPINAPVTVPMEAVVGAVEMAAAVLTLNVLIALS